MASKPSKANSFKGAGKQYPAKPSTANADTNLYKKSDVEGKANKVGGNDNTIFRGKKV